MCEQCGRPFCVGSCPNYSGDRSDGGALVGVCPKCNKKLYADDDITRTPRGILCAECALPQKDSEKSAWQQLTDRF